MSEETQEKIISEQEFAENANLDAVVYASEEETELKSLLVNYTGNKLDEENVTVNMIAEVLAFAEENFVRGYQLGLDDAFRTPKEETTEITE
jgi:hypothetical protein